MILMGDINTQHRNPYRKQLNSLKQNQTDQAGFMLIETMLALTITAIIGLALLGAIRLANTAKLALDRQESSLQLSTTLNQIQEDIRLLIWASDRPFDAIIGTASLEQARRADRLTYTTLVTQPKSAFKRARQ